MIEDTHLEQLRRGQSADAFLSASGDVIATLQASVDKRIFALLDGRQTLSPEMALQAWHEKHAYRRLTHALEKATRVGRGAAKRLGEKFDTLPASMDAEDRS